MILPHVHVISTGWRHTTASVCRSSVAAQQGVDFTHTYIEASEQSPSRTKIENLVSAISTLPSDAVVALVDGDDWLAHRRALARVAQAHASGKWVTYGSFRNSDGSPGFAEPYEPGEDYRATHWRATHLKTFRAGLFQRLRPESLQYPSDAYGLCVAPGESHVTSRWIDRADDPAFMWPIMEQAGSGRVEYVRDILYVYNETDGWHRTASETDLQHQSAIMDLTRRRRPYARIEGL